MDKKRLALGYGLIYLSVIFPLINSFRLVYVNYLLLNSLEFLAALDSYEYGIIFRGPLSLFCTSLFLFFLTRFALKNNVRGSWALSLFLYCFVGIQDSIGVIFYAINFSKWTSFFTYFPMLFFLLGLIGLFLIKDQFGIKDKT